jgi:hypothetical protein
VSARVPIDRPTNRAAEVIDPRINRAAEVTARRSSPVVAAIGRPTSLGRSSTDSPMRAECRSGSIRVA